MYCPYCITEKHTRTNCPKRHIFEPTGNAPTTTTTITMGVATVGAQSQGPARVQWNDRCLVCNSAHHDTRTCPYGTSTPSNPPTSLTFRAQAASTGAVSSNGLNDLSMSNIQSANNTPDPAIRVDSRAPITMASTPIVSSQRSGQTRTTQSGNAGTGAQTQPFSGRQTTANPMPFNFSFATGSTTSNSNSAAFGANQGATGGLSNLHFGASTWTTSTTNTRPTAQARSRTSVPQPGILSVHDNIKYAERTQRK